MEYSDKRVAVTGGHGFIGRALSEVLEEDGARVFPISIGDFDLTSRRHVETMFDEVKPHIVFHLAADVGSITYFDQNRGSVFYNNVIMNTLVIEEARKRGVDRFVGVNSVNVYGEDEKAPFREENALQGKPNDKVSGYAQAKRAMIYQTAAYRSQYGFNGISVVLDSVYGPHDTFTEGRARVIPANIRRFVEAEISGSPFVTAWGTGRPVRDFVFIDDAAMGIALAGKRYSGALPLNIGSGKPLQLRTAIREIAEICGFEGEVRWDATMPDGQMERYLSIEMLKSELGWSPQTSFTRGIEKTVHWYRGLPT